MDEMKEMQQQTKDAAQECASAWDAICSKKIQKATTKFAPLITSALLFVGEIGDWIDDYGGVAHWR